MRDTSWCSPKRRAGSIPARCLQRKHVLPFALLFLYIKFERCRRSELINSGSDDAGSTPAFRFFHRSGNGVNGNTSKKHSGRLSPAHFKISKWCRRRGLLRVSQVRFLPGRKRPVAQLVEQRLTKGLGPLSPVARFNYQKMVWKIR